jgi:hypothetical protein
LGLADGLAQELKILLRAFDAVKRGIGSVLQERTLQRAIEVEGDLLFLQQCNGKYCSTKKYDASYGSKALAPPISLPRILPVKSVAHVN